MLMHGCSNPPSSRTYECSVGPSCSYERHLDYYILYIFGIFCIFYGQNKLHQRWHSTVARWGSSEAKYLLSDTNHLLQLTAPHSNPLHPSITSSSLNCTLYLTLHHVRRYFMALPLSLCPCIFHTYLPRREAEGDQNIKAICYRHFRLATSTRSPSAMASPPPEHLRRSSKVGKLFGSLWLWEVNGISWHHRHHSH